MRRSNTVGQILSWIGVLEVVCGFIIGIIFGIDNSYYGSSEFHISIALPWWLGGFIGGVLFYGFGEVIHLQDSILHQLLKKSNHNEPNHNKPEDTIEPQGELDRRPEFHNADTSYFATFLKDSDVKYDEIHLTPFEDYILINVDSEMKLVDISGFKAVIVEEKDWHKEIKEWYKDKYESDEDH